MKAGNVLEMARREGGAARPDVQQALVDFYALKVIYRVSLQRRVPRFLLPGRLGRDTLSSRSDSARTGLVANHRLSISTRQVFQSVFFPSFFL